MSVSLYIYSPDSPLDRAAIEKAVADQWQLSFDSDVLVYGWRKGEPRTEAKRAAVLLSIVRTEGGKPIFDEEDVAQFPKQLQSDIRDAQTFYDITTSAGRDKRSIDFQDDLWHAIAAASGGLMDDPQSGKFFTPEGASIAVHDDD